MFRLPQTAHDKFAPLQVSTPATPPSFRQAKATSIPAAAAVIHPLNFQSKAFEPRSSDIPDQPESFAAVVESPGPGAAAPLSARHLRRGAEQRAYETPTFRPGNLCK